MTFVTQEMGYWFLICFGLIMVAVTFLLGRWKKWNTKEGFFVAERSTGWFLGGFSIAASWIWAPALFVSVQMAYQQGIAGIFWFTAPNILALAIFAFLAPKIREVMPDGYTLPQYIKQRFGSRTHKVYLFPFFFYQLMAVTVQLFAGGSLISLLTGIPLTIVMPILAGIALAYTLISGLEASMVTDFVQMSFIIIIGGILLPMILHVAGVNSVVSGIGGLAGIMNPLDPGVAFSFGIVTSIGLIAGAISDQQYWQRSFAIKKKDLKKAFLFGAAIFAIVPLGMSILGFLAANSELGISLPAGVDISMIGVQTVYEMLPSWAVLLFVIMLLAGLTSTLDSGLSATSALWAIDVMKNKRNSIRSGRYAMIGVSLLGLGVSFAVINIPGLGLKHLWWIFNTIAACVVVPTILSLYWERLSEKGVFWGILISFILGVPLFVMSNVFGSALWVVLSSLFIIGTSTVSCLLVK